jgi:hypothetical protein
MAISQDEAVTNRIRIIFALLSGLGWALVFGARSEIILGDPDIWWHIRTGQWIWQSGSFPVVDPFSHSFAGKPWIAKEWLSQLMFFGASALAGWNGVLLLAMAAVAVGAGLLFMILSKDLSPVPAAIACLASLLLASSTLVARPHLLTLGLMVMWTYQLFRASAEKRVPGYGWLLLMVAWANLHAAFTMGFAIAFFAFLDFLERSRLSRPEMLWRWIVFLLLCPLVSLLNPYSWEALTPTLTAVTSNEAIPMIDEWQPFDPPANVPEAMGLLLLLFATLVSGFRLGLAKALLIVMLLYLSFNQMRYVYFLFPILAVLVAPEIARQFPRLSITAWSSLPHDVIEDGISRAFRPLLAVIIAGLVGMTILQVTVLRASPPDSVAASAAIAFAKAGNVEGKVFNFYNFGGPLIFSDIKTFIDGRTDQLFLGGFAKTFMRGPDTEAELQRALLKYDIGWTLFPPHDIRVALLDKLAGWRRIFADDVAVIHQRLGKPAT